MVIGRHRFVLATLVLPQSHQAWDLVLRSRPIRELSTSQRGAASCDAWGGVSGRGGGDVRPFRAGERAAPRLGAAVNESVSLNTSTAARGMTKRWRNVRFVFVPNLTLDRPIEGSSGGEEHPCFMMQCLMTLNAMKDQ